MRRAADSTPLPCRRASARRASRAVVAVLVAGALLMAACSGDDGPAGSGTAAPAATEAREPAEPVAATTTAPATTTSPAGCDPARPAEAGTTVRTLRHGGLDRTYRVTVPPGYDGSEPAPLLLNLHGFGGNGEGQDAGTRMPEVAGQRGYVVASPDGGPLAVAADTPGGEQAQGFAGMPFWNFFGSSGVSFGDATPVSGLPEDASALGADDVVFLSALLDALSAELCIDEDRLYSTGMSNGAGMSTTLGCEIGDRLAAIAPVAGVNLTGACPGDAPVAVLAIHGDADDIAGYAGNLLMGFELGNPSVPDRMAQWAQRNRCDPEPVVDEPVDGVVRTTWTGCARGADTELWTVTGGGHVWPSTAGSAPGPFDATEVVLDFFDAHPRDARS